MICVNGKKLEPLSFPDGTSSFRFEPKDIAPGESMYLIEWMYDNDSECFMLWYIVKHIREKGASLPIHLDMPYIPNARMDRTKSDDEVFTLKWFAEFINSLNFESVCVLDPHSNVAVGLIDHIHVVDAGGYVDTVVSVLNKQYNADVLFCYPDEGAAKRYSQQSKGDYVFCIKHRSWRTGKIESLELTHPDKVVGRDILIVDDICSRGGTFTYTAAALKEAGAKNIFLYVTHCEDTIFKGSVLTDGVISHVFTTDSIYRGNHDMVTVLQSCKLKVVTYAYA